MSTIKETNLENNMNEKDSSIIPPVLAPCGVFCGACPSLNKTCLGCASQDHNQKRISKWACKIRICCYEEKQLSFCFQCNEFPCKTFQKKLLTNYQDDPKYKYRHEIPAIFPQVYDENLNIYLENQKQRWQCPDCGGTITFYHYRCNTCGKVNYI